MSRWCIAIALALCVPSGPLSEASAQAVPADLTSAVLLRALAYDRDIAEGSGPLRVAVVGTGERARALARALAGLAERVTVSGRPVEVLRMGDLPPERALRQLEQAGVQVLLFAPGSEELLRRLSAPLVRAGRMVACDSMLAGCMLSVEAHGSRPRIVVDIAVLQRSGRRVDGRLLRLARVRR